MPWHLARAVYPLGRTLGKHPKASCTCRVLFRLDIIWRVESPGKKCVRRQPAEMREGGSQMKLRSREGEEACSREEMGLPWPAPISLSQCVIQSTHFEHDISLGRTCPLPSSSLQRTDALISKGDIITRDAKNTQGLSFHSPVSGRTEFPVSQQLFNLKGVQGDKNVSFFSLSPSFTQH